MPRVPNHPIPAIAMPRQLHWHQSGLHQAYHPAQQPLQFQVRREHPVRHSTRRARLLVSTDARHQGESAPPLHTLRAIVQPVRAPQAEFSNGCVRQADWRVRQFLYAVHFPVFQFPSCGFLFFPRLSSTLFQGPRESCVPVYIFHLHHAHSPQKIQLPCSCFQYAVGNYSSALPTHPDAPEIQRVELLVFRFLNAPPVVFLRPLCAQPVLTVMPAAHPHIVSWLHRIPLAGA